MISKTSEEQKKRINEIFRGASDYANIIVDNMTWRLSLPDYQRLLLEDAFMEYQSKILGVSAEEISHLQSIRNTYRDLLSFYDKSSAFKVEYEFDDNINFDEACLKYCNCDKNSAKKIYELMSKINKKTDYHERDIRGQYEGISIDKININKDECVEFMMKQDEDFKNEIDKMIREYGCLGFKKKEKSDQDNENGIQR